MTSRKWILAAALILAPALLTGQGQGGLDPASLLKPLGESWPTYSGDYSGRRYSSLSQINQSNVKNLSLAWVARVAAGPPGGTPPAPPIVGGEGPGQLLFGGAPHNPVRGAAGDCLPR